MTDLFVAQQSKAEPRVLWDHQVTALNALRTTVAQNVRRIMLESPTGSGKTVIGARVVEGALSKGHRVAFVCSHLSLIDQTLENFQKEGIHKKAIGVIQAKHQDTDHGCPLQVCSVQTLRSHGKWPDAKVIMFDEAHVLHDEHKKAITDPANADKIFIGLSATPWTRGLGKFFDTKITVATTRELIEKGLLSKFRVFATGHPDLSAVKTVAGDYHEGQLSTAMQQGSLTADIVKTWRERCGTGKTLVFAVDCAHAQILQQRFIEAGVRAAYQDANTPPSERAQIRRQFHTGEVQIVCNVGTLTVGIDWDVRCLVLARPTKSEMLYVQIIGRALRTAPDKDYALILDHSDTTQRLGFVTDIYHEHLDDGKPRKEVERKKPLPKPCPQCDCMLPRVAGKCPNCGFEMPRHLSGVHERDGELVDITDGMRGSKTQKQNNASHTPEEKAAFYSGLKGYAAYKGYKEAWASNTYRDKFGVWPNAYKDVAPSQPSAYVMNFIKHKHIAYWKSKQRNGEKRFG